MNLYIDFSCSIYRISNFYCGRRICNCFVCISHDNLISSHISTIAVIVRSILFLHYSVHDNLYSFTVHEHIRCKPASALDMELTSSVIIGQCSPEGRLRTTIQPLIAIFHDGFQSSLRIGKDITKTFPMYAKCIISIYYS